MSRYTRFEQLQSEACANGAESVYLREYSARLEIEYCPFVDCFDIKIGGRYVSGDFARDAFNHEMRVYGWVSTEKRI